MNRKVRIGLIGCGNYGKNLLRFLDKMDCYDVISIADPDQNAARAGAQLLSYSTKLYADDAQLIAARDIDAVIIATPNDQHAEQALSLIHIWITPAGRLPLCAAGWRI